MFTKFPITLFKFQMKLFLTLLKVAISNEVSIMALKVSIEKCNHVDLPIDTSNDIYRLKIGTRKENDYLVIPKDCQVYVQMHENERISFKTIRKINEEKKLGKCQFFGLKLYKSIVASLVGS